jgi:hypothetical protein
MTPRMPEEIDWVVKGERVMYELKAMALQPAGQNYLTEHLT